MKNTFSTVLLSIFLLQKDSVLLNEYFTLSFVVSNSGKPSVTTEPLELSSHWEPLTWLLFLLLWLSCVTVMFSGPSQLFSTLATHQNLLAAQFLNAGYDLVESR